MSHNLFNTRSEFTLGSGAKGTFYSLPALEKAGVGKVSRLPVSILISQRRLSLAEMNSRQEGCGRPARSPSRSTRRL